MNNPNGGSTLPKQVFPRLLKEMLTKLTTPHKPNYPQGRLFPSLKSGFRTCGIVPVDAKPILSKMQPVCPIRKSPLGRLERL